MTLMNNKESLTACQKFDEALLKIIASMLRIFNFNIEISKAIRGRSGITHEIDIVAEKKDDFPTRLLIKCKSFTEESYLRLDEVLYFWAQLFDASADRGVIVTTCKVSESVNKFAEHHKILVLTARRPSELKYKILESELFRPKIG